MIGKRRKEKRSSPSSEASEVPEADDPNYDDALVEAELAATDDAVEPVRELLNQLLAPDAGLEQRTYDAVRQTLRDRETMMTVASLFNLGWRTPKVILLDSEESDGS